MAEVQWIKLYIDIFESNDKIKKIRRLPCGNEILLLWIMLLAKAGKCNDGGRIYVTPREPYTAEDLADDCKLEVNTVKLGLEAFVRFDMIAISEEGFIAILNWEEYQNVDRLDEIREYNRLAKQKSREKKRLLEGVKDNVNDKSMISQACQGIEEEKDKEKDINNYKKESIEKESCSTPTLEEVIAYARKNGREDIARKFYTYYSAADWRDKGGEPIQNWRQKFVSWCNSERKAAPDKVRYGDFDVNEAFKKALERSYGTEDTVN